MRYRIAVAVATAVIPLIALTGCMGGSSGAGGSAGAGQSSSAAPSAGNAAASTGLATAGSSLGTIVVNDKGMTVYVYDNDTANSGKSSCTGVCITTWPAVTTTSATPMVSGVTGKVGTIPAANGTKQITLNGHPLYTYVGDSAKGDVKGQGLQGVWWVVSPSGSKITGNGGYSKY